MDFMSNIGGYQNKESPGRIIWERYKPKSPESSSSDSFRWGRDELFTWGSVSCYWVPRKVDAGSSEICIQRLNTLNNQHYPESKGWALYQRTTELLLNSKERRHRMKWKLYSKVQHPGKWTSYWEERLSPLPEGEWAVAESQRRMSYNKVKLVCQGAKRGQMGIF